jgi:hypothetical protein
LGFRNGSRAPAIGAPSTVAQDSLPPRKCNRDDSAQKEGFGLASRGPGARRRAAWLQAETYLTVTSVPDDGKFQLTLFPRLWEPAPAMSVWPPGSPALLSCTFTFPMLCAPAVSSVR